MSGGKLLRRFLSLFYVPSGKDFVANLSVYFFLLVLAGVLHYFTDVPDKIAAFLNPRAPSVSQSLLLLAIGFGLNFVPVFFAIDNYFMNVKQTARAAIGTTACVCLLYTLLWKTFTSGLPQWRTFLSLLHGSTWPIALRMAMSGSLISVVTSFKLGFSGNLEAFDFKDVRRYAVVWKELVRHLETNNALDAAEHEKMKKATTGILEQLRGGGRMQKSVLEKAGNLYDHLGAYGKWYEGVTKPGLNNLVGLTNDVRSHVTEIRKLL
jgi:hypothetical protein